MNKIELLAPAKDVGKAKIAILYGADAVYVGGKQFSLRSRASNFSLDDLREIVPFAHEHNAKLYVTVNMVFHDEDLPGIREYLQELEKIGVDAIIVSSIGIIKLVQQIAPKIEAHVSTQISTINSGAVSFFKAEGAKRVVLARECSIEDIEQIAQRDIVPLEVFIHGGMCSNYSGRCVLSNRMTNRDANRGGCAHSCRWKYRLYAGDEEISDPNEPLSFSSKDLRATAYIPRMIKCGVASLKIEGRMKSDYYIAQVVKTYRKLIDEVYETGDLSEERIAYYENELDKAENRPSADGFLSGSCDDTKQLYGINGAGVTHDYVALVKDYDQVKGLAVIEVKNRFAVGDYLEVFGPTIDNYVFENKALFNMKHEFVSLANKPTEILYLRTPIVLHRDDMIRKVHSDVD